MEKVLFAVLFASSLLVLVGSQEAWAATTIISDQASCEAIPGAIFDPDGICLLTNDFTVSAGDTLIIENLQLNSFAQGIDFTNFGTVELNGGSTGQGVLIWVQGDLINECGAVINANGNTGVQSGMLFVATGATMTNKGTINLFGNDGTQSGSFGSNNNLIQINNHGNVNQNPGTGFESGVVWGFGSFNDNLPPLCLAVCGQKTVLNSNDRCIPDLNQICGTGTIPDFDALMCFGLAMETVGGALLDINTVSLLVGAIGTNPVITGLVAVTLAGVVGQAVWFVNRRRKSENS